MKKALSLWLALLLSLMFVFIGCDTDKNGYYYGDDYDISDKEAETEGKSPATEKPLQTEKESETESETETEIEPESESESESKAITESESESENESKVIESESDTTGTDLEQGATYPLYTGEPFVSLNNGMPLFTAEEIVTQSYEFYSPLDALGRCGVTVACIGTDLMPTEDRESISSVKPSGWVNNKYDTTLVEGGYIYNRSHLIGFQLTGENANENNLITGTRYFNVEGMLPFENMVADYLKEEKDCHVMYRVTPIYEGDDLVARGVQMEAYSVEDDGESVCFNVFVFNIQPGIVIDYATGNNWLDGESRPVETETEVEIFTDSDGEIITYVLNTSSKKFHTPSCSSVDTIKEHNKEFYYGEREALLLEGYSACGSCKP